jgi:hypothetical protein
MTGPTSDPTELTSSTASLSGLAPGVIGATGGSGTRVVARIVRHAGMFIGTDLNNYEDALPLAGFSDRWINKFVTLRGELPEETRQEMAGALAGLLESHRADMPDDAAAWGWKEPRSIYLLRFLDRELPAMRFLQFVRDGRDMAFSENQNQLKKHGEAVLDREERRWKQPVQSIAVWARVNGWAAEYGEREMGDRYTAVTFEELCARPAETVERIWSFFGLSGDAEAVAAAEVNPPASLGRWRGQKQKLVDQLHEVAGDTLARFGYTS